MEYRRDIDGLRTIAVLLVIFDHAGFHMLSGGFTGVDVFFVISGYLITGIIYNKSIAGNFSFGNFYVRRIRRLMPALFVMLGVSTAAFSTILLPEDLVKYGQSVFWVGLYLGNFFFWRAHGGYFEGNAQEAPMLHTWSLAVEEQYYLLWPVFIVLGLRILGKDRFLILTVITLLAFTWLSEWATNRTLGAAYYLMPSRFFELMIGSVLAMYWQRLPTLAAPISHLASLLGLGLIIYGALTLDGLNPFPGYNALYPTIGAALIILSNQGKQGTPGIVNRLLSLRPIVFVGLLSYSLYLWHWPIFVYMRYTGVPFSLSNQLIAILLTFVLAYFSWRFVEKPVRSVQGSGLAATAGRWFALPVAMAGIFMALIAYNQGFPQRFSDATLAMNSSIRTYPTDIRDTCHARLTENTTLPDDSCILGADPANAKATALLIGDSHANHITGFVDVLASSAGIAVQDYTMDQCPPIFDLEWGMSAFKAVKCEARNDLAKHHLVSNNIDYAILAASWPGTQTKMVYIDGERADNEDEVRAWLTERISSTVSELLKLGIRPIVLHDISWLFDHDPRCPLKREAFNPQLDCSFTQFKNDYEYELFAQLKAQHPELIVISPEDANCIDGICRLSLDDVPLYHDSNHLTDPGARKLAERYLQINPNPLAELTGL